MPRSAHSHAAHSPPGGRPSRGLLGTLLCLLAACGTESPGGTADKGELIVRFDLEEKGWAPPGERTQEAAHRGDWGGYLNGTHHGSSTFSPLIHIGEDHDLEVSWWARIEGLGPRGALLMAHGYRDAPSPHAAIPSTPLPTASKALQRFRKTPDKWQKTSSTLEQGDLGTGATWLRLEWRLFVNREERDAHAGYISFDDVTVRRRSRG